MQSINSRFFRKRHFLNENVSKIFNFICYVKFWNTIQLFKSFLCSFGISCSSFLDDQSGNVQIKLFSAIPPFFSYFLISCCNQIAAAPRS